MLLARVGVLQVGEEFGSGGGNGSQWSLSIRREKMREDKERE